MAGRSKYNFPKAEKVQIFEKVDTYIETQHYHASDPAIQEEVTAAVAELKALIDQIQTQNDTVTSETEALAIIEAEFTEIQRSPTHHLSALRQQLLNPERHAQAIKATLEEVLKHYLTDNVVAKAVITYFGKMSETPDKGD